MTRAVKALAKDDIRSLTGPERSAILMLALGEEHGLAVWKMLDEDEIKEISQIM
jgi:flagellar motor switch protein FliG